MLTKNAKISETLRGCIFKEPFDSATEAVKNGGTITGTIRGGKLYCVSGTGASFARNAVGRFLTNGGSLRLRWRLNDTSSNSRPILFYGTDANYLIKVLHKGSDGTVSVELRNGSGNNYYLVRGTVANGQVAEIVATWNKAGTTLTLYVNGVYSDVDATAGSLTYTDGTTYGALQVGYTTGLTASTDVVIDEVQVYNTTILTAQEIADYFNNATFTYNKRATVILPMTADTHDATGLKTLDVSGKGNHFTFGDGSTATTFPTKLSGRGYYFDGGDSLRKTAAGLVGASGLTMFAVVRNTPTASQAIMSIEKTDVTTIAGLLYKPDATLIRFYGGGIAANNAANITAGLSAVNVIFGITTGSVTSIYCNGVLGTNAVTPAALLFDAAQGAVVGARGSGTTTPMTGDVLAAGYYRFALTPLQILDATYKLKKQLNVV